MAHSRIAFYDKVFGGDIFTKGQSSAMVLDFFSRD